MEAITKNLYACFKTERNSKKNRTRERGPGSALRGALEEGPSNPVMKEGQRKAKQLLRGKQKKGQELCTKR